jgi:hypothetical protein
MRFLSHSSALPDRLGTRYQTPPFKGLFCAMFAAGHLSGTAAGASPWPRGRS